MIFYRFLSDTKEDKLEDKLWLLKHVNWTSTFRENVKLKKLNTLYTTISLGSSPTGGALAADDILSSSYLVLVLS